jgi:hypothetical protein
MRSCDDFSELLLDHLYGLLEPDEDAALRAHLSACPKCQAELQVATKQQSLLARAAQTVRELAPFVAPVEKFVPVPAEEPSPAVPISTKARRFWRRPLTWAAAAAAVLIAVAGGIWRYQNLVADYRNDAVRARKQVEGVDVEIALVHRAFQKEREALAPKIQAGFIHLHVVGPAAIQSDASAPFRVTTRDVAGRPQRAETLVRWRGDETREFKVESLGEQLVELPAGLTSREGRATIEVESRFAGRVAKVSEAVEVKEPAYVTHLALSKSSYRIGELLFFRTLTLERSSLKPPADKIPLRYMLKDERGQAKITLPALTGEGGIAGGEIALTEDLIDGTYTLEVAALNGDARLIPVARRVEIQRGQNAQIEFDRRQYRAGDDVTALFRARRDANGTPMANQPITGSAKLDGKFLPAPGAPPNAAPSGGIVQTLTDERGVAALKFRLPENIDKGNAVLEVQQHDGKLNEKFTSKIPVVASRLAVDFFPEGGDLVAGVPTRVYYRVRTPLGEPAAPEGHVILMSSKEVLLDSPRNQGIGVFTFTPELNETYTLRVTWPKRGRETENWVETMNPFQDLVQARGVALAVPEAVAEAAQPIAVTLRNTGPAKKVALVATCRGRIVDQKLVDVPAGVVAPDGALAPAAIEMKLTPVSGAAGLMRITAYEPRDGQLIPLSERLVYRPPARALALRMTPERPEYQRGDRAELKLHAVNERGEKSPAWLLGLVVEERVAPEQPSLPAYFYLLSDLQRDVDSAEIVLGDSPTADCVADLVSGTGALVRGVDAALRLQARQALDLYLGTNGWRRFVRQDEPAMLAQAGAKGGKADNAGNAGNAGDSKQVADAKKAAALADVVAVLSSENVTPARLVAQYQTALEQAVAAVRAPLEEKLERLAVERGERFAQARAATSALVDFEEGVRHALRLGSGILLVILLSVGGVLLLYSVVRMARRRTSPRAALVGAMLSLLVAVVLYSAGGKLLRPDGDNRDTDGLARLAEQRNFTLAQDGPALAAPARASHAQRQVEGFFFGQARPAEAPDTRRNLGADKDQAGEQVAALARAPLVRNEGGAVTQGDMNRRVATTERFLKAAEAQKRALAAVKKEKGGAAAKGKVAMDPAKSADSAKQKSAPNAQNPSAETTLGQAFRESATYARTFAYTGAVHGPMPQDIVSWEPLLFVPAEGAVMSFGLPSVPTTYRVLLYGNDASGRLGFFQGTLRAR